MLLVVLLSAAPTGGQPRTRLVGSAFDPATTSVVVSPKRPKVDASVEKTEGDKRLDLIASTGFWPAASRDVHFPIAPASAGRAIFPPVDSVAAGLNPLARSQAARAPPQL